ncbi:MAG: hypothetical protein JNK42_00825 [Caedimonas sp.]|nr:hypothetical protein [Caedimonas sp.]
MKERLFWQRIVWVLFFFSQSQISHGSFLVEEEQSNLPISSASDYEIARLVQEEENKNISAPYIAKSNICDLEAADRQKLVDLSKRLSKFPQGTDVHHFNKNFAKEAYQKVYSIDQKTFCSSSALSLLKIREEINLSYGMDEQFKRQHQTHIIKTFNIISKIPSAQTIEPETRTNLLQLLSRVWNLAQKIDQRFDPGMKQFFHYRNLVLVGLADNISQGGGCHAGIAGRLIQNYVTLSLYYFNILL